MLMKIIGHTWESSRVSETNNLIHAMWWAHRKVEIKQSKIIDFNLLLNHLVKWLWNENRIDKFLFLKSDFSFPISSTTKTQDFFSVYYVHSSPMGCGSKRDYLFDMKSINNLEEIVKENLKCLSLSLSSVSLLLLILSFCELLLFSSSTKIH